MDIKIVRGKSTPEGTPGKLDTGMGFTCDTFELPWDDNQCWHILHQACTGW